MTTILYDIPSKTMYADSQATAFESETSVYVAGYSSRKLVKVAGEHGTLLLGSSGDVMSLPHLESWVFNVLRVGYWDEKIRDLSQPSIQEEFDLETLAKILGESGGALAAHADCVFTFSGRQWPFISVFDYSEKPFVALGTGAKFAESAMLGGADAQKAMQIAISQDPFSGGEVKSLSLEA